MPRSERAGAVTTTAPTDGGTTTTPAAPDKPTHPAPPAKKDAPRTMRDLRLASEGKKRPTSGKAALENPLREGLRLERVPDPATFVLFGATGDLAHRKVIPALYHLWRTHLLPHEFMIVALGRRDYSDESFRDGLREVPRQLLAACCPSTSTCATSCAGGSIYHRVRLLRPRRATRAWPSGSTRSTRSRARAATGCSTSRRSRRRSPEIVGQLGRAGLDHERHDGGWRRVVIEKPFGRDLESAVRLNREVGKVFRERQVYRIDHYLGKETVRNLLVFRFAQRHLRAASGTGATSTTCRSPWPSRSGSRPAARSTRRPARRATSSRTTCCSSSASWRWSRRRPSTPTRCATRRSRCCARSTELSPDEVARDVVRGQYGPGWVAAKPVIGYREEPEVDPQSETETFIAARLEIDDWRWADVPFYLRMGKRLPKRSTEIAIQFKEVPHRLFKDSATDPEANLLAMRIQPDEGIMLRFGAKVPGLGIDVRSVNMDFTYGSAFQTRPPGRVRDADPRRAARRRLAVHAGRRGRGGVAHRRPDHRRLGRRCRRPSSRTTRPGTWGPEAADELLGPRRPPLAADLMAAAADPTRRPIARAPRSRRAALRWIARAPHSIDGIERELARIWAQPNLTATDVDGERGRHIAARTSVMNLVVVARQPEIGEHSAAIIQQLTGRHPSRTLIVRAADPGRAVVARRPDPGPLRAAARRTRRRPAPR